MLQLNQIDGSAPGAQIARQAFTISEILERLARLSRRPRYAFMVLNLIAEAADERGQAGPFIHQGNDCLTIREWLAEQLAPTAERDLRRAQLRARVARELGASLGEGEMAKQRLDLEVAARVRDVGRANVSRAMSDLVKAGFVRRHYSGYVKNHRNRGGRRQAVYTVTAETMAVLRRRTLLL